MVKNLTLVVEICLYTLCLRQFLLVLTLQSSVVTCHVMAMTNLAPLFDFMVSQRAVYENLSYTVSLPLHGRLYTLLVLGPA